ncbi:MAG: DUF2188 domain-containing protein [Synechococcus sp. SB0668_bin_15]|nr:DUF2188 domain-containing protein [Synechococcus sp. SB0668_bin_15]MYC48758.1 DUF2188 domain-containing protein [Synechococcus sp. SB0662_bin_14]
MTNGNNYWTQQQPDGQWESKRGGARRATTVTDTQAEAWEDSRQRAREEGGEAFLKGRDGKIRERNSYGNDAHPPNG